MIVRRRQTTPAGRGRRYQGAGPDTEDQAGSRKLAGLPLPDLPQRQVRYLFGVPHVSEV